MRVTNETKRKFISWLIENYNFKRNNMDIKLMLTHFRDSPMINRIEFVSKFSKYVHTIYLSTSEMDNDALTFKYFTSGGGSSTNLEASLSHIEKNVEFDSDEYLEIVINFNGVNAPEYQAVIDGGPNQEVEAFLAEVQKNIEIDKIKQDIDSSLAEMNKDKFMALTDKLKQIIG